MAIALERAEAKNDKQKFTRIAHAKSALQGAFTRFLENRPPEITTMDQARSYLLGAAKCERSNERRDEAVRRTYEAKAVAEQKALGETKVASAEALHRERAEPV